MYTINCNGERFTVKVTEWTKRPKGNGFYIMVDNPTSQGCLEIIDELKTQMEIAFNFRIKTWFNTNYRSGFTFANSQITLKDVKSIAKKVKQYFTETN